MNLWQTYRSLTDEQKRILKEKQLSTTKPVGELLALLQPLADYDRLGDRLRTRLGCTFAAALVLGTIILLVAASKLGAVPLALLALIIVALAVFSGAGWRMTRGNDLSDNLRAFALPVLALLREDIDRAQPMQIRLDLRAPLSPEKKIRELPPAAQGVYHKVIESHFVDPWFDASATLGDGSRLHWNVVDTIRERRKTKKTPRGKIKTKTKYAKKTEIDVALAMKKKSYDVAPVDDASIKDGANRNDIRLRRTVESSDLNAPDPKSLIDALTAIYRSAVPAK
jgi:hypothetical protein